MPLDLSPAALAQYTHAAAQADPPSPPPPAHEALWPYLALFGGQGADLATTAAALRNPNAHELNPLGTAGMTAAKLGVLTMLTWLMHHEHETGHDTAAKVIGTIGGLAGAVPATWNLAQMQGAK